MCICLSDTSKLSSPPLCFPLILFVFYVCDSISVDLIDRVPNELWMEVRDIVQEIGIKTIPMEKKCKKSKMAVWGGLTNSCEKKRSEKQKRKREI